MADNIIQGVGRVDGDGRSLEMFQVTQNREASDPSAAKNVVQPVVAKNAPQTRPEKVEDKPPETSLPVTSPDILLKFNVDDKTHDITVYLIDRASKQVLRTIPADEINKLKAGDLLRLLA